MGEETKREVGKGPRDDVNATACRDDIRDLQATADFFGIPLPTIRDWVRQDCPVEQTGGNGVPYEISLRAVAA